MIVRILTRADLIAGCVVVAAVVVIAVSSRRRRCGSDGRTTVISSGIAGDRTARPTGDRTSRVTRTTRYRMRRVSTSSQAVVSAMDASGVMTMATVKSTAPPEPTAPATGQRIIGNEGGSDQDESCPRCEKISKHGVSSIFWGCRW